MYLNDPCYVLAGTTASLLLLVLTHVEYISLSRKLSTLMQHELYSYAAIIILRFMNLDTVFPCKDTSARLLKMQLKLLLSNAKLLLIFI